MAHLLARGSGGTPPEIVWLHGSEIVCSSAILGCFTAIPPPLTPKKVLIRFTLISRMVLVVGKKSEDFDHCSE